ncbi:TonB-dependent receptor [Allosphingosinicella flava]|uniref:TonB-dependent receptor n=1 Tax=Allosphingosinicella flava TaxID=2771430 RepID=A0A7T2LMJ5_9SPHN|nr:TonB-dependent receptor [Sphingosinicella flava]QPQ55162.1 TonB-dependent receptor [Sphingosinicella flava]
MRRLNSLSLSAASVLALTIATSSGIANAQEAPQSTETSQEAVDETPAEADNQEIIVTGSRIARPELDFPNPVTTFSSETLEQSGQTNLTEFLSESPALISSQTSSQNSGSTTAAFGGTSINLLDLRNLGTNRTLVLVDGRRHVGGLPGTNAVDINTIPKDLLDRVDVLTGGTSAIYGADGVSGVVNFVLKRDFEGLSARGQAGISEEGDAGNRFFAITAGKNFAQDRGNVAISYEFTEDDRVSGFDRRRVGDPRYAFSLVRNPADFPDNPNVYDRILLNDLRYADSSRDSAVDVDLDGLPDFTGTGKVYDRGRTLRQSGGLTQGGDSTPLAGYQGDLQPDNRVHNVNLISSFEVSEALRLFAQGKYVNTRSYSISQPSFDFFTYLAPDNPFLIERFGTRAPDGALISRDNFDLGVRGETVDRETIRAVFGADGRLGDHARYEVSYVYGKTKSRFTEDDYRLGDRYYAALDAVRDPLTGRIVCRSTLFPNGNIDPNNYDAPATTFTPGANSGCVPLNLLGEYVADPAAIDWINVDLVNRFTVDQHVVSGFVSGDLGGLFQLPGGPIGYAVGAEYRKESSDFVSDPYLQAGELLDLAQILPEQGSFDVKEVFGEVNLPILANMPFAHTLSVGGAVRLSDYSTIGTTTTWSVNGVYAPVRDVRFRATYSEAVRAPNITELFSPENGTFSFIDDPCDPVNIPEGTQFRQANCTALLTNLGIDPATFSPTSDPTATVSLPGRAGGNPDLEEETAKTWTAGIVFTPTFLRNFTLTADWYNIKLANAVSTPTAQELTDLCVDQPTLDNAFCALVGRDPDTGYVNDYLVAPQNVAEFRTAGLDLSLNYRFTPAESVGTFNLRIVGNYLDKLTYIPTPGADIDDDRTEAFAPKYSGTFDLTWVKGPLSINYGLNYFSKTRRYTTEQVEANPDIADPKYIFYREKWQHDLRLAYDVSKEFEVYGGVNNLTDEKGDVASTSYPYNFLGRFFYIGARVRLADIGF